MKKVLIFVFSLFVAVGCLSASSTRKVLKTAQPSYPPLARQMHISGTVKVEATVSSSGKILNVKVVGGHPVLSGPAAEAARQFVYEPAATETVETISFNFVSNQ